MNAPPTILCQVCCPTISQLTLHVETNKSQLAWHTASILIYFFHMVTPLHACWSVRHPNVGPKLQYQRRPGDPMRWCTTAGDPFCVAAPIAALPHHNALSQAERRSHRAFHRELWEIAAQTGTVCKGVPVNVQKPNHISTLFLHFFLFALPFLTVSSRQMPFELFVTSWG